jgi:signal transduction histidine kinase
MSTAPRPLYARGLTLQVLALVILPLTVVLTAIAVGSIAIHQQVMSASLPAEAQQSAPDPALELTLVAPLVLLAPLLFALAALWFGARQIVQPLQRLESKAAAVALGDFDTIQEPVGGISEVQHLQAELAAMARTIHASQAGLHDYIGAITAAQEDERMRLARELHDDTIQELVALKQRLQLARKARREEGASPMLEELELLTEATIENVRRMTRALRPIYLEDLGLVTALEMLTRETSRPDALQVDFQKTGPEQRLSGEAELALYRIAQQALNNVVRHAQARHAVLQIEFVPAGVQLEVRDDGRGFQPPRQPTDLASSGHFGLLGMRERADLIGARLEVLSEPGKGTHVVVRIPLGSSNPTAPAKVPA